MHNLEQDLTPTVGVIYGTAGSTEFDFAVTDGRLRRLDYVSALSPDGIIVLGQVMNLKRESSLSHAEALTIAGTGHEGDEKVTARVHVIGYRDDRGLLQVPRTPFSAGTEVRWAQEALIQQVIGLESGETSGAYLGTLKGTELPVHLNVNTLVQKHVSVLAKTGAGKSYCTGVLMEELLKRGVAVVIIDAHDEYHSLAHPTTDSDEIDRLLSFGLKPKSFAKDLTTWTTGLNHRSDTRLLKLEGSGLSASELAELAGGGLTTAQRGILYQAIKDARVKNPLYTLADVNAACQANKSNSKWNVIAALETLEATGLFDEDGVAPSEIVQSGKASIISLKGVPPDSQEIVVARLAAILFEARKDQQVPPFLFVVEEAHNYCPERGLGNALSSGILRTIASEGRKFGMGLAVVTQRPAKVDKNVLSQCNTQIVLKVTNPNDLKAIASSVEGLTGEATDEIARLPVGVALVAGGNLGMPVMVEIRTRQSRHGGAGVNITQEGPRPAARIQPGPDYASQKEIEAARARKEAEREKERARQERQNGRSKREVVWGDRQKLSAQEPEAPERTEEKTKGPSEIPVASHDGPEGKEKIQEPVPDINQVDLPPVTKEPEASEEKPDPGAPSRSYPSADRGDGPQPLLEPRDTRIHRVANRIGYVTTGRPTETLDLLRRAAARSHVPASRYTEVFARIGRTHCHREDPQCGTCPLNAKCAYKRKLDAQAAQQQKGVLGRFFQRRS
jgi:uncharacterized protein